jgi:hypothetical protein
MCCWASAEASSTLPVISGSTSACIEGWRWRSEKPEAFSVSGAHWPVGRTVSPTKNSGCTSTSTPRWSSLLVTSGIHASLLVTNPSVPTGVRTAESPPETEPGTRSSWLGSSIGVR